MTEIGWRLDWIISTFFFQKRTLSKSTAKSLHSTDLISNEKIKKAIQFEFQPIQEYIIKISPYFF
jgi:hypothetical protein